MVFVLSKNKEPLMLCHYARARQLLKTGRAVIHKRYPITIRLKDRRDGEVQPVRIKIDPGSKTTGIALVSEDRSIWFAEINHKPDIKGKVNTRRSYRRRRRSANLRYRAPRFDNRRRDEGWLPPSLQARVDSVISWSKRLSALCPITDCSVETVRFDTQKLVNPEIKGVEYQRGTLFGYEVREYLLEKWGHKCVYCGDENVPLEVEHIVPKSRGGTDRITNLTLSCNPCNQKKDNLTAEEFGYPDIQKQALNPLKDAAAVNAARKAIYKALGKLFGRIEVSTGGRTKFNRTRLGLPKTHYFDALCVGESTPGKVKQADMVQPLIIACKGRGQYCRTNTDAQGFPKGYLPKLKIHFGLITGDMVKAVIPKGKYAGTYMGNVAVRASGYVDIKDIKGRRIAQGINHKYIRLIHRFDGYYYLMRKECATSSPRINPGASVA